MNVEEVPGPCRALEFMRRTNPYKWGIILTPILQCGLIIIINNGDSWLCIHDLLLSRSLAVFALTLYGRFSFTQLRALLPQASRSCGSASLHVLLVCFACLWTRAHRGADHLAL